MKKEEVYLGVDIGSVSCNFVLVNEDNQILNSLYIRTKGNPISAIKKGLKRTENYIKNNGRQLSISGVGTTGSGRELGAVILGSDVVKNEITAHAVGALNIEPKVKTILEIGGQDSKLILLKNGIVTDFAMNTVCAAGTGSFLDRQAERMEIPIEEFGDMALAAKTSVRIAGRCAVFAESDMIHKQQMGYTKSDIAMGLCEALTRNYLSNLAKGKNLESPIIFQGGVAANKGIIKAFEEALGADIIVPKHHKVMGAIGVAILAKEDVERKGFSGFYGFELLDHSYQTKGFECNGCANACEVVEIYENYEVIARWGDRCGKWVVNRVHEREERDLEKVGV